MFSNNSSGYINNTLSSFNTNSAQNWESYDDITRISLEIMFHQYYKSNSDVRFRFVDIDPTKQVDLKEWVEVDNDDKKLKKKIKRVKNQYKTRPSDSKRF